MTLNTLKFISAAPTIQQGDYDILRLFSGRWLNHSYGFVHTIMAYRIVPPICGAFHDSDVSWRGLGANTGHWRWSSFHRVLKTNHVLFFRIVFLFFLHYEALLTIIITIYCLGINHHSLADDHH